MRTMAATDVHLVNATQMQVRSSAPPSRAPLQAAKEEERQQQEVDHSDAFTYAQTVGKKMK